jgi:hypothetical protein
MVVQLFYEWGHSSWFVGKTHEPENVKQIYHTWTLTDIDVCGMSRGAILITLTINYINN